MEVGNQAAPLPTGARARAQGLLNRKSTREEAHNTILSVSQPSTAQPVRAKIKVALSPKLANSSITNILRVDLAKTLFKSRPWV